MKKIIMIGAILANLLQIQNLYGMVGDQVAASRILAERTQAYKNHGATAGSGTASGGTDCSQCPAPCDTTTVALPPLSISLYDANGTIINTYNFPTDSSFIAANAILSVHIFSPSNSISSSKVTAATTTDSYAVVYTLKSTNGNFLQKAIQYGAPTGSPANPSPAIAPTQIPVGISIATNTGTPAVITPLLTPTPSNFIPTGISSHTPSTQQRIFNGLSPINQKFLIVNTGTSTGATPTLNATATPISGMFDTDESTVFTTFGPASSIQATSGTQLSTFTIQLTDATTPQTFTFGTTKFFNQTDLINGLALNVHIFPPSLGISGGNNSYILIATLRTIDGLKLHKQILQATGGSAITFSPAPYLFSIALGTATTPGTTLLIANVLNSSITQQSLNIICPLNIRCMLQSIAGTMTASIL